MNKLTIIGNLTKEPETRITSGGSTVCQFTVAVNRRSGQNETDFFRVSAWERIGENCMNYLHKGNKVGVVGEVTLNTYEDQNTGEKHSSMNVRALEVEFLTPAQR